MSDESEAGGNCLKYFKSGWNTRKGRANKDFMESREVL